jgi:hypothetical protein
VKDHLECNHCGCTAIVSESGLFTDGTGEKCMSCGFPGSVSCDSETDPYWSERDGMDDVCDDLSCEDCKEYR